MMKIRTRILLVAVLFMWVGATAQIDKTANVFLITLDGVRWQDVYHGLDTALVQSNYTEGKELLNKMFSGSSPEESREKIMPFFWNTIAKDGQLYGNRTKGSKVDLTNKMLFSYPGYNEILTGKADDAHIDSNDKNYNKNVTVLELANKQERYKGKVAAFASWDVFPFIINDKRSGIPVNAGYMNAQGDLSGKEIFLNEMQRQAPIIWESVRLDVFTHHYAKEYVKKNHPKVVYISYGETDDFAHGGKFDFYMKSLHNTDALIADLWQYVQQDDFYKDNTYFIITTDHGRGSGILEDSKWTSHGSNVKEAQHTWMAILGPNVKPVGEAVNGQLYTDQLAPTIAEILDVDVDIQTMPAKPINLK
ncbi:sulfatase-like hydrolase/transferase [Maribacter dokdonensis]|uniref:sulfatase-like hydrolase/transferase n=1 Tax=Maribacter dokdonensis TaxID=320912 RepID=UPI002736378B|nr:sulfatase-like hydrolase/transferase [Maribacter dokdonensis]MDP2525394.1 sulfatase-like hydrolase/transferase [Maribacter dokdonensis]